MPAYAITNDFQSAQKVEHHTPDLSKRLSRNETKGLIILIVLIILAVGAIFCIVVLICVCRRKRTLKKRNQTLVQHQPTAYNPVTMVPDGHGDVPETQGLMGGVMGRQGRYQKVEDDGVWSADMHDGRRSIGEERGPLMGEKYAEEAPWNADTYNRTLLARQSASRESLQQPAPAEMADRYR